MNLSRREQAILAAIEEQFSQQDAELTVELATAKPASGLAQSPLARTCLRLGGPGIPKLRPAANSVG
jgi:hypothetical protein